MARSPVLACAGLTKRYGTTTAVDHLSFTIAEGETYGLLGPNGAGKTTAISMIVTVVDRDGGEILIDGQKPSTRTKALIGYVPQEVGAYMELTARENLRFFSRLYGMRDRSRVERVLEATGLTERADEVVSTYSGGMARRLNIAIGLLNSPRLLVLDEPTAGVDPQSRNAILGTVSALADEGAAVLYTTHYMEEAERLCDRVGILDHGRLIAEGTPDELRAQAGEADLEAVFLHLTGRALRD
ncbi:ABC transporter ATP-binding protein [Nonomuraea soli]|uniref:ABC-2 type transport system ATP-binding protein n=1 Tax=Nonomuraea soli TaxID=1032476 RepID=A0A7W0CQ25_9ACTN|nr:ABC transporter ATP-binding protein [Nonomuraea soli]MBA2895266.1 ABC-2 type transport system ATP-binding protein [Nonomuraea soli]